jgi:hypothetical protein
MRKDTDIDRIIEAHFGDSTEKLCAALRVTKGAVSQWRKKIPPRRMAEIELILLKRGEARQ